MVSLLKKYAPRGLVDVVGQPEAIAQLRAFAAEPFPAAFVFHGPTGVGKSCTAKALALDLGCTEDYGDMGGITEIPSGTQDGRAVEAALNQMRLRPFYGSGWKLLIINEADYMTAQAEAMWLDGLEHLPPKSVVIFTTNNVNRLTKRLLGRCEVIGFSGDSPELIAGMHDLVRRVWLAETGAELNHMPADIGLMDRDEKLYSVRVALQQIAPLIRAKQVAPAAVNVALEMKPAAAKRPARVKPSAPAVPAKNDNTLARWREKAAALGLDWPRVHAMKAIVRSEDREITPAECWERALARVQKEMVAA